MYATAQIISHSSARWRMQLTVDRERIHHIAFVCGQRLRKVDCGQRWKFESQTAPIVVSSPGRPQTAQASMRPSSNRMRCIPNAKGASRLWTIRSRQGLNPRVSAGVQLPHKLAFSFLNLNLLVAAWPSYYIQYCKRTQTWERAVLEQEPRPCSQNLRRLWPSS